MTVIEAPIKTEQVTEFVTEPGDHEKLAHIVWPPLGITDAYIFGTPLEALCGKRWVPTRAPDIFPVCQKCVEVYETDRPGRPWKRRRA